MKTNFMQSKIAKAVSCLLIAMMMITAIPVNYSFAATDQNGVDCEWYNFRNNQENNGVTNRTTPTSIDETAMKWGVKYGTGWGAAPTPPLLLNGKIYIGMGNQVLEIDKKTGEKLRESEPMAANVGYAMNPILYADGRLFVQVGNGIIQAIDLDTLKVAWQTPRVGGQTLCPISYTNVDGKGYIYTGTWMRENADGRYMCFTTDDENVTVDENGKKIKAATWQFVPSGSTLETEPDLKYDPELHATLDQEGNVAKRGFYWSGCYATDKYIAIGSDDGTSEGDYTANAVFYTLNPTTGEIIDRIDNIKGDIRTTTVYDNGYLYFSTKGGHMYKVSVDEEGNMGEPSYIDLGGMTTASPLVYKGKIYIGVAGPGGQFDPDGGHGFAVVDNTTETLSADSLLYKLPIKGYPQASALLSTAYENEDFDGDGEADGRVYIYFTYNANPGGIYYTYDTPNQKEAAKTSAELFIPSKDKQQYCISTICTDYEGTLYYKNDSCYLMAVETNPAYVKDIKATADDGGAISWDQPFSSRITEYNLVAKDTAKKVTLEIKAADGATVEVDGKAYSKNSVITLNGSENKAVSVVAKKDGKQRTYTLNIRTTSAIASLENIVVNTSNQYGILPMTLAPEFKSDVLDYDVDVTEVTGRSFYNLWPDATDPTSTVEVIAGANNAKYSEGQTIPVTSTNLEHQRYAIYPKDKTKSETVKIKVTSENGKKTETYSVRLLIRVDVTGITLNETTKDLLKGDTFQLEADLQPKDATNKNVTWSSLDENVAKIDENGLVTATGAGTTTISAVSVSGSKTASCTINVTDLSPAIAEAKADLAGYKDKNDYRVEERQAMDSILTNAGEQLDKVRTEEEIAPIVAAAKAELDALKTDADYTAEEVKAAKSEAQKSLEEYFAGIDQSKYRDAQKEELKTFKTEGESAIEAAETVAEVENALHAAKENLNSVKTDAELTAEEDAAFAKLKENAAAELDGYKNFADYRDAQQKELEAIVKAAKDLITNAETAEEVEQALTEAKAEMDKIKTDAELTEEELAAVIDKIDAIGTVTLESGKAIADARDAYEELPKEIKEQVTNYEKLTAAEEAYQKLLDEQEQEVKDKKNAAKKELADYLAEKGLDNYREAEQKELQLIERDGGFAIDAAADNEAIEKAVANAKAEMDKVKTDAQLTEEEEAILNKVKEEAKADLDNYKDFADYREAEQNTLTSILDETKAAIDEAASADEIAQIVTDAKAEMDKVKTDAQLTEEEAILNKVKEEAKADLDNYKDFADYREAEKNTLTSILDETKAAIDEAASADEIAQIVTDAKAEMDKVKTDAQLTEEENQSPAGPDENDPDQNNPNNPGSTDDNEDQPVQDVPSKENPNHNGNGGNQNADTEKAPQGQEPTTGDTQNLGLWIVLLCMAGMGTAVTVRRKENK